ncbi:MAG: glutamyl-Q tRNA(Asp) synthetase [Verrucomicrobiales bacterium]
MSARTRFAPSPSGLLHLGHACSALAAWEVAGARCDQFILRIEDIDGTRCKQEFEVAIYEDLTWLGLSWNAPVMRQSERAAVYASALDQLKELAVIYPCFCTRREIQEEIARSVQAPHGPDGALYPGICKSLSNAERQRRQGNGESHAWRLDAAAAAAHTGPLQWTDLQHGKVGVDLSLLGDVVIARKDIGTSYHLAVVVDDAAQGVEVIVRGNDLYHATHVHRMLQQLLALPVPHWQHHPLICDENGQRLAKRSDARSIRNYRESGVTQQQVFELIRKLAFGIIPAIPDTADLQASSQDQLEAR